MIWCNCQPQTWKYYSQLRQLQLHKKLCHPNVPQYDEELDTEVAAQFLEERSAFFRTNLASTREEYIIYKKRTRMR